MLSKIIYKILGKNEPLLTEEVISSNELSVELIERIKNELSCFAVRANAIHQKEEEIMKDFRLHRVLLDHQERDISTFLADVLEEKRAYSRDLSQNRAFQEIMPWVYDEVCRQFTLERIEQDERWLATYPDEKGKVKINKAKSIIKKNPRAAAELFFQLGTCHSLWGLQRSILKEKFDVTWFSPGELNPDTYFD